MAKKTTKKMSDDELQRIMRGLVTDAIQYTDAELSPERAQATDYYKAEKLGNEEEGRSQIVLSEVRDGVLGVLPSILRVIFGPERVVEFTPSTAEAVERAGQATDYVQKVFAEDNSGFLRSYAVLKDGLTRKIGIFKWGWEDEQAKTYRLPKIPQADLETLMQNGAEPLRVTDNGDGTLDVEVTHTEREGCPWVCEVPPEEFIFDREARSIDEAVFVGHRMEKTTGELLALGVSQDDIDAHGGGSLQLEDNIEEIARQPLQAISQNREVGGDANEKHLYIEGYAKVDFDGDGKAELRKVCTLGDAYHVLTNEPAEERPFSMFCPDPEPHVLLGQSLADRLMDIQRSKSMVMRSTLDSLAASIFPRTAYQEGMVSVQDILNTEIGAPIRTLAPPSQVLQAFSHPFVGQQALPVLELFDEIVERRTGRNKGTLGLDADALQSTTQDGVTAAVTSAQEQAEMLVRIFAEMTLKPLFRGLLRMLVKYQPREKMAKLRGQWVPVNPATWDADMDVTVNVALGTSDTGRKMAVLQEQKATQESILQTLGPQNPICTLAQYRYTLSQILELAGRKDVDNFYQRVQPDWAPPPAPEPPPSPEMVLAQAQVQIEHEKTQRELAIKAAELDLKRHDTMLRDDRERDKNAADITVRLKELELKYKALIDDRAVNADIEHRRITTQAAIDHHATVEQAVTDRHATATQAETDRQAAAQQAAAEPTE